MRECIPKYRGFIVDKVIDEAFPSWVNKNTDSNLYLLMASLLAPFETIFHSSEAVSHELDITRASLLDTVRFNYVTGTYESTYNQRIYDNHENTAMVETDVVRTANSFFSSSIGAITYKTRVPVPFSNFTPSLYWSESDITLLLMPDSITSHYESIYPFTTWSEKTGDDAYLISSAEYYSTPNYYNHFIGLGDDTVVSPKKIMNCDKIVVTDIHHKNAGVYYSWTLYPGDIKSITAYKEPSSPDPIHPDSYDNYPYVGSVAGGTYNIEIHFTENHEFYIKAPASPTYYIEKYSCSRVLYDSVDHASYISTSPKSIILDEIKIVNFEQVGIEHTFSDDIWTGTNILFRTTDNVDTYIDDIVFVYNSGYIFEDDEAIGFQNNGDSYTATYNVNFSEGEKNDLWHMIGADLVKVVAAEDIYQDVDGVPTLIFPEGVVVTSQFEFSFDEDAQTITITYIGENLSDSYKFNVFIGYKARASIPPESLFFYIDDSVEYDAHIMVLPISDVIVWDPSDMSANALNRDKFLTGSLAASSMGKCSIQDFCYVKDNVVLNDHFPVSARIYKYDRKTLHIEYVSDMEEKINLIYDGDPFFAKSITYYDGYILILDDEGYIYKFDIYNNNIERVISSRKFSDYLWIRSGVGNTLYLFTKHYFDIYNYVFDRILYDFEREAFVERY